MSWEEYNQNPDAYEHDADGGVVLRKDGLPRKRRGRPARRMVEKPTKAVGTAPVVTRMTNDRRMKLNVELAGKRFRGLPGTPYYDSLQRGVGVYTRDQLLAITGFDPAFATFKKIVEVVD